MRLAAQAGIGSPVCCVTPSAAKNCKECRGEVDQRVVDWVERGVQNLTADLKQASSRHDAMESKD